MLPLLSLLAVIAGVVVATTRWRIHPFLALLVGAAAYGLVNGLSTEATLAALTAGFGRTVSSIGIVIACGCVIGAVLERTGAALVMANAILRAIGVGRAVLSMSITGAVVSVPVFCDSGYVVLSPLARTLAQRTGQSMAAFAVALSMGLYATHCLVPPTPGPVAATAELRADLGRVIGLGLLVAVPVVIATCVYAVWAGRRWSITAPSATLVNEAETPAPRSGVITAFAPILLPVGLIAARSLLGGQAGAVLAFVGDPNVALILGAFLALALARRHGAVALGDWTSEALKTAGAIVLITAAGGALGAVLRATPLSDQIGRLLAGADLGKLNIILPFLVAAGMKTAQGSSTVAMITTASLVAPLTTVLGLDSPTATALAVIAIGAGSMVVSHVNDSYFWVVTQLSGFSVTEGYRLVTIASAVAGASALAAVVALRLILP